MATFTYQAKQADGANVSGVIEADDVGQAMASLRARQYWVVDIRRKKEKVFVGPWQMIFYRVKPAPMAVFFGALVQSVRAGISLGDAMDLARQTASHRYLRRAAGEMTQPLHNGQKLSVELAKRPTLFPSLCIELVKAGEESGQLEKMLEACRQYLDGMHQTEQAIKVATIYPRVVAVLGIIMAVGLSVLVRWVQAHVPYSEEANKVAVEPALRTFASVAKDLGLLVGVAIGAFLAWRILSLAAPFRWAFDTLKMNLPWVAAVTARLVYSRFGKTLATCYSAGLPMTRSVELASDACGNVAVGGSLKRAVPALQSGAKLSEALTAAVRLPPTVMQVIATGERTGRLDETLTQAAEIFDREAQAGSRTMAVLTGLLALLVLAGIIGAVYIGFMKTYYEGLLNAFSE